MNSIAEVIAFANSNPVTWLATVDGDQPHLRAMAMWFADQSGFYYHTGTQKRLAGQLKKCPRVELGFISLGDMSQMQMVRVTGKIEMVEDAALEKRLFEERTWLNDIKAAWPDDNIFIFRIAHGVAQYWDMSRNCREKSIPPIVF